MFQLHASNSMFQGKKKPFLSAPSVVVTEDSGHSTSDNDELSHVQALNALGNGDVYSSVTPGLTAHRVTPILTRKSRNISCGADDISNRRTSK